MKILGYLLSLAAALPCVAFALGLLALDHVSATRNLFTLLYHFFLAFGRGLPLLALALLCLLGAAFFPTGRLLGALALIVLNLAALAVILCSPALPKTFSEAAFLLPAFLSTALATILVLSALNARRTAAAPDSKPTGVSSKTPA
ncbi:MAG TPA: hypothetical protein VE129_04785 [Thermoanaerobaculia bacterium]|nr:hypothetical protein [Thermoanaerobaculia bacterium]